jgi:hypothetical protein
MVAQDFVQPLLAQEFFMLAEVVAGFITTLQKLSDTA